MGRGKYQVGERKISGGGLIFKMHFKGQGVIFRKKYLYHVNPCKILNIIDVTCENEKMSL